MTSSLNKGLIQVYYGDGKGKTTAAFGQSIRMLGHGYPVIIIQFLKGRPTGEISFLKDTPNLLVLRGKENPKFLSQMTPEERKETRDQQNLNLKTAAEKMKGWEKGLLVLDEGLDAYALEMVDQKQMEALILNRSSGVEVVITGHSLPDFFEEQGNYITEMKKIRHPYDQGVPARKGIEQ